MWEELRSAEEGPKVLKGEELQNGQLLELGQDSVAFELLASSPLAV